MDNLRITAKGIKREARGLLTNNWSRALGALCIYLMVIVLFVQVMQLVSALLADFGPAASDAPAKLNSFADYLAYYTSGSMGTNLLIMLALTAFFFLISAPLSLGITSWYRRLILLENLQVGHIFRYFQSNDLFFGAIIFQALSTLIKLVTAIVSFLPGVICLAFAYTKSSAGAGDSKLLLILGAALIVAGLFAYLLITLRIFFAKYLYCGDYGYGPTDCLKYSNKYMKKHIGSVLSVILSFTLWFASCIFILPAAYVIPFFNASMAACAQDIIDEHMGDTLEKLKRN